MLFQTETAKLNIDSLQSLKQTAVGGRTDKVLQVWSPMQSSTSASGWSVRSSSCKVLILVIWWVLLLWTNTYVLLKIVPPHHRQLSCSVVLDVGCHTVPWPADKGHSAGLSWESRRQRNEHEASHNLSQKIQSSATLPPQTQAAGSCTAAPGHELWPCGLWQVGRR